ncbi:MAG: ATP-binding protein [Deltaproteobacteria bacterium]|nr:ATP-binding protein [Deltaproteobacteria bacterium]
MRSLQPIVERDLEKRFVLLAGPRQVGKTHLALEMLKAKPGRYYNWDLAEDRQKILEKGFLHDGLAVMDELHKYERWKSFLKGTYDKYHEKLKILVTGSARLDVYRRGGDSLFGRHYLLHLHPLTVGEILTPNEIPRPANLPEKMEEKQGSTEAFSTLLKFGGFPHPFYQGSVEEHGRWSIQRRELLVRQDIRDLTHIHLLNLIEHFLLLLPRHVGSVLSVNSLKEDLQVAYNTVRQWLGAFERLYISFALQPYHVKVNRSLQKASKVYLWDWSQVEDEGDRLENMIASHLLKAVHLWRDLGFGDFELFYLRDRDRREVDFCVTKDRKPWLLAEVKLAELNLHESLHVFAEKFGVPAFQIVGKEGVDIQRGAIRIISASRFLSTLP